MLESGSVWSFLGVKYQSKELNMPPQTPKFPPNTGARALIAEMAPIRRSPYGEFRKPFTPCHTAPPIAYVQKPFSLCVSSEVPRRRRLKSLGASLLLCSTSAAGRSTTYPHRKGTSKIIQCHPRTRVSCVVHPS